MRQEILREMLHDPNFNPGEWLDKALINYIAANTSELVKDKSALPYLLRAMDAHEVDNIAKYVARTKDLSALQTLVEGLKIASNTFNSDILGAAVREIISNSSEECLDQIIGNLVEIPKVDASPTKIINKMTSGQVAMMIKRWKAIWNLEQWGYIINRIDDIALLPALKESNFKDNISIQADGARKENQSSKTPYYVWPAEAQDIIVKIINKVSNDQLPELTNWVRELRFTDLYSDDKYTWMAKKLKTDKLEDVPLDDRMCRCGFVAASPSGITLHLQLAASKPATHVQCNKLQVCKAIKVKMARSEKFRYMSGNICKKCGAVATFIHERSCIRTVEIE